RSEYDPFPVGREAHVRLQAVIVFRHVYQALGAENAGVDQRLVRDAAVWSQLGTKQVEPLSIRGVSDLALIAAVAAEELAIVRHIEVDRPLVALQMVPSPFTIHDVVAGEPEIFAARRLQIVPNHLAVGAPEFMSEN